MTDEQIARIESFLASKTKDTSAFRPIYIEEIREEARVIKIEKYLQECRNRVVCLV